MEFFSFESWFHFYFVSDWFSDASSPIWKKKLRTVSFNFLDVSLNLFVRTKGKANLFCWCCPFQMQIATINYLDSMLVLPLFGYRETDKDHKVWHWLTNLTAVCSWVSAEWVSKEWQMHFAATALKNEYLQYQMQKLHWA